MTASYSLKPQSFLVCLCKVSRTDRGVQQVSPLAGFQAWEAASRGGLSGESEVVEVVLGLGWGDGVREGLGGVGLAGADRGDMWVVIVRRTRLWDRASGDGTTRGEERL